MDPISIGLLAIKAAPLLGRIFGGGAKGAADQRMSENDQRLRAAQMQNQDAIQRAGLQSNYNLAGANLDLNRRAFQQQEPNVQANQALRGSLISRLQPLQMSGLSDRVSIPQMNSILSAIGPEARQAGSLLARRGLSGLESGPTQFDPLPALNLPPSVIPQLQKSGLLEKILGGAGLVGSVVGALGDLNSVSGGTNNAMPSNYTGKDMYGNPSNFQLPRWDFDTMNDLG